jgi:hypothetical protein
MNKEIDYIKVYYDDGYEQYNNNESIYVYVDIDGKLFIDIDGQTVACYASRIWECYTITYKGE